MRRQNPYPKRVLESTRSPMGIFEIDSKQFLPRAPLLNKVKININYIKIWLDLNKVKVDIKIIDLVEER
jgi:hypothetical protein